MTRNSVIGAVVVIAVLALGAWYFTSPGPVSVPSEATSTASGAATTGGTAGSAGSAATFRSIFSKTGNYECDFTQTSSAAQGNNVIYIADGKMRGEFRTSSGGISSATLMIYTGGYLYSWKEGATAGTKTRITSLADLPTAVPKDLSSAAILGDNEASVSWNCHAWDKNPSVFTLPSYVSFK